MSPFAIRVLSLLEERQETRMDLARATGINKHRLYAWFTTRRSMPNAVDVLELARHFNVSQEYLLNGGDRQPFNRGEAIGRQAMLLDDAGLEKLESFLDYLIDQQRPVPRLPKPDREEG